MAMLNNQRVYVFIPFYSLNTQRFEERNGDVLGCAVPYPELLAEVHWIQVLCQDGPFLQTLYGYGSIAIKIPFWMGWTSILTQLNFDVNKKGVLLVLTHCHIFPSCDWFIAGCVFSYVFILRHPGIQSWFWVGRSVGWIPPCALVRCH